MKRLIMFSTTVNIITSPARENDIRMEMEKHGISAMYWPWVRGEGSPIKNINKAHKNLIRYAKKNNLSSILCGEDDCRMFGEKGEAFHYFLSNRPKEEYDIYLSSYYGKEKWSGVKLREFAGMTLYEVKSCYYDIFLSLPDARHIDRAISSSGARIFCCDKFCTFQANGFSYQRRRNVDDSYLLRGKPIFGQ